jgi:transcriptional regulator with XRE-family HTH domain
MLGGGRGAFLFLSEDVRRLRYRKVFGKAIRSYRQEAGLTQEKLARRAGLHHNFIGEVERGNMECSLTSMVKIARALRVRVADLVRRV